MRRVAASSDSVGRHWSLEQWLHWQETLHPASIDLGLERVAQVAARLGLGKKLPFTVIVVAGTNGKGSSIAMLEAICRAGDYSTAAYTSPHLLRYNERLRLDGKALDDAQWCAAFERVDAARGDTSLTYFEFGTLAALCLLVAHAPDVALLEIGLGGRLDAVNIIDADATLITNIALDHQQWLGHDRESIAAEKAGVMRAAVPAVFGEADVPQAIVERAAALRTLLIWPGRGYEFQTPASGELSWCWQGQGEEALNLPLPALPGSQQIANAAAVIALLRQLHSRLPLADDALRDGLRRVELAGRMQEVLPEDDSAAPLLLDVAHNPHASAALAARLAATPVNGSTLAVIAVLDDKDLQGMLAPMLPLVDGWYCAELEDNPRALPSEQLVSTVEALCDNVPVHSSTSPQRALQAAAAASGRADRIVVFGSFFTVAAVANA